MKEKKHSRRKIYREEDNMDLELLTKAKDLDEIMESQRERDLY